MGIFGQRRFPSCKLSPCMLKMIVGKLAGITIEEGKGGDKCKNQIGANNQKMDYALMVTVRLVHQLPHSMHSHH